ncbi:MAG: 2-C-methyl-D-erythritol 4-phosphate cytidylyltransferase [Fimbriimonadales bacterium]|nr:2-C-methyl-D-erythritol 4-phosphate cytidylyltransferase [Fimbriimonadales bacterium]
MRNRSSRTARAKEGWSILHALILAAGSGVRFGKGDKLWQRLNGAPVWRHALWRLLSHPAVDSASLAVAPDSAEPYESFLRQYPAPKPLQVLPCGGATRQQTVANALRYLPEGVSFVAVHDAARPLVSHALLNRLIETAQQFGTAVPALPVQDTLKRSSSGGQVVETVPREGLYRVQTPQVFRADWLINAHRRAAEEGFDEATDDAQLLERAGYPVHLTQGDPRNIKLTTSDDLNLLRLYAGESALPRTGIGYDIHQLTEGRKLMLGGVAIDYPLGLKGHSDADVVLHAICDALLGAATLGDIGQHFPNSDPRWKDAPSLSLLQEVGALLQHHGWRPLHIDAMVLAEAPKIAPHVPLMRTRIAQTLGMLPEQVSIKATTNEGMDAVGAQRAIACYAVATIYSTTGEANDEQIPTQAG